MALSPDGRYLAYQSQGGLTLRAFDQLDPVRLASVPSGRMPLFSPDSQWIGFFDRGDLKKVAVTGEPVITLSRTLGNLEGGAWGDDGTIVVPSHDPDVGLRRVPADGGEATVLTKIDAPQAYHTHPSMLPGRRGVLYTVSEQQSEDLHLGVLDLKSGQQKILLRRAYAGQYLDTGHLIYAMLGSVGQKEFATLWVDAFDLDRLALRGEPVRVGDVEVARTAKTNYAVSRSGALAYVPARAEARSFVWVDRATGRETAIDG
jgi:hypothetical protein